MKELKEDGVSVVGNSVSAGNIAGIGAPVDNPFDNQSEPGVKKKKKKALIPFKTFTRNQPK